nr:hypothetical protein CFP56_75204 [Quercus suber]
MHAIPVSENQMERRKFGLFFPREDEDGFEDSEKETKIKRSSDDSDGEGAGPSGEATSNDIDVPHPKSVQLPNLIQRLMLCLGNWIGSLCAQRQGDSDCEEEEFQ